MTETRYGKHIIEASLPKAKTGDGKTLAFEFAAAPYGVDASWVLLPIIEAQDFKHLPTHSHDFSQFINWFGADPANIGELPAEAYICLGPEQERHIVTEPIVQTLLPGVAHCPGGWTRVDKPVFHLDIFFAAEWVKKNVDIPAEKTATGTKYGKYLVPAPIAEDKRGPKLPRLDFAAAPYGIDAGWSVVPVVEPVVMEDKAHRHEFHQFLCFISTNPYALDEFDAEIEVHLGEEGEKHVITSPTVLHIPPGLVHCPMHYRKVGKPLFQLNFYFAPEYKQIPA